jgi:N-acetylglutamate synthase-like GNAT family acetyltransferase
MYCFKKAETKAEFEQIFRLNYAVFARELGQYDIPDSSRLEDKFHSKNQYAIALENDRVVGMIAFHDQPPFSVAAKLADPRVLDALGRIAEIRLLAIDPAHRNGTLLRGLLVAVYECAREHDAMVISGYSQEERMYRTLGFKPLGPAVKSGNAEFVPMAVRLTDLARRAEKWRHGRGDLAIKFGQGHPAA